MKQGTQDKGWEEEFIEKGADLEHDRWSRWQKRVHQVFTDGKFEEFIPRWEGQISTQYAELSEEEKESDRKETRNYLPLIRQAISQAVEVERVKIMSEIGKVAYCPKDRVIVDLSHVMSIINKK